ncbi:MAG TPA: ACT domain-containing protein, partial [Rhodospirillales bacterium]|nr:ACT domain-containing protein [Rhodospirillales bacterium]
AVLTCADICAVGPKTWTSWKSSLLRGLFLKALEFLSGDVVGENRAKQIIQAKNRFREGLVDWQKNEVEQHVSNGSPSYWLSYDTETHMQHAKIIQKAKRKNISVHIESRLNETFDYSEITVYAPDHPGIFSEIAGVMALSNVTVMDAKIATMADGMVLDSFAFIDTASQAVTSPDKMQRIADRIEKTLAGELNIEQELKAAPLNNLKKSVEAFTVASRVIVNNNASSSDTVIEVNGRDRVGLLYDVTATLTRLGLKISSAHITTFGEEVVDTFYIKDAFGLKVSHKEKIQKIRQTLLKAVPANNPKNNYPGEQLISPTR